MRFTSRWTREEIQPEKLEEIVDLMWGGGEEQAPPPPPPAVRLRPLCSSRTRKMEGRRAGPRFTTQARTASISGGTARSLPPTASAVPPRHRSQRTPGETVDQAWYRR
jgi:hypothetical protein